MLGLVILTVEHEMNAEVLMNNTVWLVERVVAERRSSDSS